MPLRTPAALSAATFVAAFWLSGCAPHAATSESAAVPSTPMPASGPAAPQGAPLPDPVALTDLLGRVADPGVPGTAKLPLVEGATSADATALDKFTRALQDNHMVPLVFTATNLAWSAETPGDVVAAVRAAGPDPKAGAFSFPMEFTPDGNGWQLSRRTADMLLVFGDSPGAPPPAAPPPAATPAPAPPAPTPTPTR